MYKTKTEALNSAYGIMTKHKFVEPMRPVVTKYGKGKKATFNFRFTNKL